MEKYRVRVEISMSAESFPIKRFLNGCAQAGNAHTYMSMSGLILHLQLPLESCSALPMYQIWYGEGHFPIRPGE